MVSLLLTTHTMLLDMKRNILLFLAILLVLAGLILSYFRFFKTGGNNVNSKYQSVDVVEDTFYWNSYLRETFDNDVVVDSSNNNNYYLEMDSITMRICTNVPANCDEFNYKKDGKKYIINTSNEKILKANLTIEEDVSEEFGTIIKIIKTYDDEDGGYSVFYFKQINK